MTGLGGGGRGGGKALPNYDPNMVSNGGTIHPRNRQRDVMGGPAVGGRRGSSYAPLRNLYQGGPTQPNTIYNVNELGPENIYSNGAVTRGQNPVTIDGQTGYVEPNIQGRAVGGFMPGAGVMGDMYGRQQYSPPNKTPQGQTPLPQGPATPAASTGGAVNPGTANGGVMENPGGVEGGYNFMTDPGYEFRKSEGMRGLERSAAARGGLLSGGFGRKAIRYGQDYASNEYTNVYNRIANIAGLGQVATNQSGMYAMNAGQGMGTAAAQGAYAQASGQQAAGNAWANAGNQIAQAPWGEVFNRGGGNNDWLQEVPYTAYRK
jgi:hypothetical protein